MPLMRINYYIYARRWKKLVQELGKVCFRKSINAGVYILILPNSEIFFEVGSDGALFENTTDDQCHLEWQTLREITNYTKVKSVGNVAIRFW